MCSVEEEEEEGEEVEEKEKKEKRGGSHERGTSIVARRGVC